MTSPIQLVIPAAGAGTRFRDVGVLTPKPLIEIAGYPMIMWVMCNFHLRADDSVIVVSQRADELQKKLKSYLSAFPCPIHFLEIDGLTEGPASTVEIAIPLLSHNSPIIVANSDQYVSFDLTEFIGAVRRKEYPGTILTMDASGNKWSYIGRNIEGTIEKVIEKEQISNEATVGIYGWSNLEILKNSLSFLNETNLLVNNEFYIAPSFNHLISKGLEIGCISVGNHGDKVHGLGTPEDLQEFLRHPQFHQSLSSIISALHENQISLDNLS